MVTDEILIEHGYRKYNDTWYNADCLFQKRVKDDKGTKYFINFLGIIYLCLIMNLDMM